MKVYKTAKLEIMGNHKIKPTIDVYRKALGFIIRVCHNENSVLFELVGKNRASFIENLIHATSKNPNPKYKDFDELFYKYPTYLRRSTIALAIGIVSSYLSSVKAYKKKKTKMTEEGKKFKNKPPKLSYEHEAFPVFYKDNMFDAFNTRGTCRIKLFLDNDWKYVDIRFNDKSLYSSKSFRFEDYMINSPSIVFKSKRYYLYVPFYKNVKLSQDNDVVVGVDLGLTKSAVVCAIRKDGTVIDRLFINQYIEKDRLEYQLKRLNTANRISGTKNAKPNIWRKINNLITSISVKTANDIVRFALKNNAKVIVFEHLRFKKTKGDGKKRLRAKTQYWAKIRIQRLVENKAHSLGIRFSRVSAKNTSALAFDGSGIVTRNTKGDIATFANGKIYHADLNASYNIAARYFLRELERAKVPVNIDRIHRTLNTLIDLAGRNDYPFKVA